MCDFINWSNFIESVLVSSTYKHHVISQTKKNTETEIF